ncbi:MAG TPA: GAF domain-containing protein, partial [Phototrophicaceae bacterium]|nr:GAF domain-containing protein [Phototrophicaceae bacterium]
FVSEEYGHARLGVIDPGKDSARIIVEMDQRGEYSAVPRRTGALSTTPLTREVLSKEPIIVGDDGHSLTLPLVATDDQLIGVVQFINPHEAAQLPNNKLRALRSLADQMTTSLQNRFLLQQMEDGLKETRALYQAISALLSSDDTLQMLEVLYDLVADDADYVSLVSLAYDNSGEKLVSFRLEGVITAQGAEPLGTDLVDLVGLQGLQNYQAGWGPQVSLIEYAEHPNQILLVRPLLDYYKSQTPPVEIESNLTIPVIEEGVLRQLVSISYRQARIFDHATRRLFNAIRDQMTVVMQNQRLIQNTRTSAAQLGSQVRVLQTLNELSVSLSSANDEKLLLDEACKALYTALRLDHVGITMLNADGASATVASDYPSYNLVGLVIEDTNELQVQIRNSRAPIYLQEVSTAPGLAEASRQELSKIGIHTMLLLPLLDSTDRYLGAAGLEFSEPGHEFTPEMIDIGRNIAAQTAVALQSIREVKKTQSQASQLQQLARFSQVLQAQLDVSSILDTLIAEAPKILSLNHISVMLYDSTANKLRLVVQYNNGQIFKLARSGNVINEGTTAGQAWATREFVHVNNLRQDQALVHTFNSQMISVMSGPMFARGVPLGVIEISSMTPYAYSDIDLIIFRQLISLVGVAQENAETYMQSQRLAQSKALVNEISNRIQQQTDLTSIMDVTVSELGRALGARRAKVRLGQQSDIDASHANDKTEQW